MLKNKDIYPFIKFNVNYSFPSYTEFLSCIFSSLKLCYQLESKLKWPNKPECLPDCIHYKNKVNYDFICQIKIYDKASDISESIIDSISCEVLSDPDFNLDDKHTTNFITFKYTFDVIDPIVVIIN